MEGLVFLNVGELGGEAKDYAHHGYEIISLIPKWCSRNVTRIKNYTGQD